MRGRRRDGGFTIVEALVAFTLLAVLATALYAAFGDSAERSRRAARREQGQWAAQSLLDSLSNRDLAMPGKQERALANGFRGWFEVTPAGEEVGGAYALRAIEIGIVDLRAHEEVVARASTFRLYVPMQQ
jgi:type II secretory pathway pseudopilin PulG